MLIMEDKRIKEIDMIKTGNGYANDLQATSAYYSQKNKEETEKGLKEIKQTLLKIDKQNTIWQILFLLLAILSIPNIAKIIEFVKGFFKYLK